jgi:tripartite-type tricarboxylate transporter receptor subunit TctC
MIPPCTSKPASPAHPPRRALLAGAGGLLASARRSRAEAAADWPQGPVHFICPYPPGGAIDTLCRLYGARMAELTGSPFVVENRVGAGGTVGTEAIARARPDGQVLGQAGSGTLAIAPVLYGKLPYDAAQDLTLVCGMYRGAFVVVVAPTFPAQSAEALLALLRANPGRYNYASPGVGTPQHLAAELLKSRAGSDMLHVPYRGGAAALLDLLAGRVDMLFDIVNGPLQAIREGKVRALAVLGAERAAVLPEVPAMAELLPDVAVTSWSIIAGPARMPAPIVARISEATREAMASPALIARYRDLGIEPWWTPGDGLPAFRAAEETRLAPIIRASGARPG